MTSPAASAPGASRALWTSTAAFTICFAVWTIFSILGLELKALLGLGEAEFGLLISMPILSGAIGRFILGLLSDHFGGRRVMVSAMVVAALSAFMLSFAETFAMFLLAGFGIGVAGGAFAAGISFLSGFYTSDKQSSVGEIFGVSNVGAAVTVILAPLTMVTLGWQATAQIWGAALLVAAVAFLLITPIDRGTAKRHRAEGLFESLQQQLDVLRNIQIWRFSVYYFFVFGAFVALALWLPRYLMGAYGLDLITAGILSAAYIVPASVFRPYGGKLCGRYGARSVMYIVLGLGAACCFMLSYPPTTYIVDGAHGAITFHTEMGLVPFLFLLALLGVLMSLGKAAVFQYIPAYYPHHVGLVGGVVGMVGALGGFVLPIVFGAMIDLVGIWTSSFAILFLISLVALIWMHAAIRRMEQKASRREDLEPLPEFPELQGFGESGVVVPPRAGPIAEWKPEDPRFWEQAGRSAARRNLWISTYCLLLSFAVWMVWSVVVAQLPSIGFAFTTDQLFWLAAVPGLSGATLRIFYAFMVPIFGGRLWTTLSTGSLLIPAFGIGYAVQNPDTPYLIFLVLALLCGFGGGNFASSVANISFFFPKSEKGSALAINSGLGNLGVSLMQFVVPVVVTMSLFGALGGSAQVSADGELVWMQNAGFFWVPLIILGTLAAWFGMNDILSAKSSFADQATIFGRLHTWLMCWLYTGTFGTFIGMSAGFPLLAGLVFPEVNALRYAFIGPLLGALSRAGSGWIADRVGGARVTLWVFVVMIAAVFGMIWFLDLRSFWGFFAMVLLLFLASGIGNASTFQMVPGIMRREIARTEPQLGADEQRIRADRESAAIVGFISAIAAYGAFYIPKAYGSSIDLTGAPNAALWGFLIFYVTCAALTWLFYGRTRQPVPSAVAPPRAAPAHANKGSSQ